MAARTGSEAHVGRIEPAMLSFEVFSMHVVFNSSQVLGHVLHASKYWGHLVGERTEEGCSGRLLIEITPPPALRWADWLLSQSYHTNRRPPRRPASTSFLHPGHFARSLRAQFILNLQLFAIRPTSHKARPRAGKLSVAAKSTLQPAPHASRCTSMRPSSIRPGLHPPPSCVANIHSSPHLLPSCRHLNMASTALLQCFDSLPSRKQVLLIFVPCVGVRAILCTPLPSV